MQNNEAIDILALAKGGERYVVLLDASTRAEAFRAMGRWAANSELTFTWYDAAVLSQKLSDAAAIDQAMDDYQPPERFSYE